MTSDSLVSIVTPCYNGEKYISRFLESVLSQDYPYIELIFVNDGSNDQTEEIVKKFIPEFEQRGFSIVYRYKENGGQASALNEGLKLFHGVFVTWLDSDDEISQDFVSSRVNFLENNKEVAYCYGKAVCIDEETGEILNYVGKRNAGSNSTFFLDIMLHREVFFSGYMVRTEKIDQVIHDRAIFCGKGGQNAQLLLPLAWNFGEPGFVEWSEYKYYIRNNSHSHSALNGKKAVEQLINYQEIVRNTLLKINDDDVWKYYEVAEKQLAIERFGNAIDSKNPEIIKAQYKNLKAVKGSTRKQFLLMMKYSNPVLRIMFRVN